MLRQKAQISHSSVKDVHYMSILTTRDINTDHHEGLVNLGLFFLCTVPIKQEHGCLPFIFIVLNPWSTSWFLYWTEMSQNGHQPVGLEAQRFRFGQLGAGSVPEWEVWGGLEPQCWGSVEQAPQRMASLQWEDLWTRCDVYCKGKSFFFFYYLPLCFILSLPAHIFLRGKKTMRGWRFSNILPLYWQRQQAKMMWGTRAENSHLIIQTIEKVILETEAKAQAEKNIFEGETKALLAAIYRTAFSMNCVPTYVLLCMGNESPYIMMFVVHRSHGVLF